MRKSNVNASTIFYSEMGEYENTTENFLFAFGHYNYNSSFNDSFFSNPLDFNDSSGDEQTYSGLQSGYTLPRIIAASCVVVVMVVVIVFGNALVCVAIAKDRNLKTTQNWFIACLAVADLLIGLIIIPFSLANEMMGYWFFGYVWCELWKAFDVLLCTASINSLCLISLDRYWSITRALHYPQQRTPKRAAIMIALVWILSASICVPPLIGWRQGPQTTATGHPLCLLSDDIGYVLYSSLGSFFIPCVCMVFVYARVYYEAIGRARKNVKSTPAQNGKNCKKLKTTRIDNNTDAPAPAPDEGSSALSEGDDSVYTQYNPQNDKNERKAAQSKTQCTQITEESLQDNESHANNVDPQNSHQNQNSLIVNHHIKIKFTPELVADATTDSSNENSQNRADIYDTTIRCDEVHKLINAESDSAAQTDTPLVKPNTDTTAGDTTDPGITTDDDRKSRGIPLTNLRTLVTRKISREASPKISQTEIATRAASQRDPERAKRKIAKSRERRATIVVGIVMLSFIMSWLPFFVIYLVAAICQAGFKKQCFHEFAFSFFFWLGYCNSAFNPIIYTIFNRDFRHAFQKILFGRSTRPIR